MPIITITADSAQKSREIAEKAAETLGYRYVDRKILSQVAVKHNVPEPKLIKAMDEPPSIMRMSPKIWKQYLTYVQEAVLGELLGDNIVCHGLAAQVYVLGVSHVLKIGIIEDPDERARNLAAQGNISMKKAKKTVELQEKKRKRWSSEAFGLDVTASSLYDMVINISQIDPDEAVGMITTATEYRKFKPNTYSIKCLQDRELAARVQVALLKKFPDARVQTASGNVVVEIKALKREKAKKVDAVKEVVGKVSGVHYVEVHVINDIFRQAAESGR